jgi:hypothetical protein
MIAFRRFVILPIVHMGPCETAPGYLRHCCGRRNPRPIPAVRDGRNRVRCPRQPSKQVPPRRSPRSVALGGDDIGPVSHRWNSPPHPTPLLGFSAPNSRLQLADSQLIQPRAPLIGSVSCHTSRQDLGRRSRPRPWGIARITPRA